MKLLISEWKELEEVGPQAQHIIFNNLRTLIFHPLHFSSKALSTLTRWDHAWHKLCVQDVTGSGREVETHRPPLPPTNVVLRLSIKILLFGWMRHFLFYLLMILWHHTWHWHEASSQVAEEKLLGQRWSLNPFGSIYPVTLQQARACLSNLVLRSCCSLVFEPHGNQNFHQ